MEQPLNLDKASPEAMKALMALDTSLARLSIEPLLIDLVKLRASQINGCAYHVDMHARDGRNEGESERRLYAVPVCRETAFFTPRERAPFNDQESVDRTLVIGVINVWNRFGVGYRMSPAA